MPVSREDVIAIYRYILGREPENEEVIRYHQASPSVDDLRLSVLRSLEFAGVVARLGIPPLSIRDLRRRLSLLPQLNERNATGPRCKICDVGASPFDAVDFWKFCDHNPFRFGFSGIQVRYYRCQTCDYLFTDFCDSWSKDDFVQFIYNHDYPKVDPDYLELRAERSAAGMAKRLRGCESARILDYGSGSGAFVGKMRRRGFVDISGFDPFSEPDRPTGTFDVITAFEVVEHSTNPMATFSDIKELLSNNGLILIGQTIQPANIAEIGGRWWYLAPRNGHVSTFSERTFAVIAKKIGLNLRCSSGLYAFSTPQVVPPISDILASFPLNASGKPL